MLVWFVSLKQLDALERAPPQSGHLRVVVWCVSGDVSVGGHECALLRPGPDVDFFVEFGVEIPRGGSPLIHIRVKGS